MLAKWSQRENFRGENPRGGRMGEAEGGKAQEWLVHMG